MLWRSLLVTGFICSTSATEDTVLYIGPNSVSVYSECSTIFLVKGSYFVSYRIISLRFLYNLFFMQEKACIMALYVMTCYITYDTLKNKVTSVEKVCGS